MRSLKYGRYEVRNVVYDAKRSIVGDCCSLDVWVDGEFFARVENDGNDAQVTVTPIEPFAYEDVHRIGQEMQEEDSFLVPGPIDFNPFETGAWTLMRMAISVPEITEQTKKKAVYVVDGQRMKQGYAKASMKPDQRLFDHVKATNPGAVILNGMDPFEAAKLALQLEREANPTYGPHVLVMKR